MLSNGEESFMLYVQTFTNFPLRGTQDNLDFIMGN
jgi:hypothetical protein